MRICICDDDAAFVKHIAAKINKNRQDDVSFCSTPDELSELLLNPNFSADVVLMDIVFGSENGIDAAAQIAKRCPTVHIIFVTGYAEQYGERIFLSVRPWGIIRKPIKDELLYALLNTVYDDIKFAEKKFSVSISGAQVELDFAKIICFESEKRKLHILTDEGRFDAYMKLDAAAVKLDERFIRCHKSFVVNSGFISEMQERSFKLKSGMIVPIGGSFRSQARSQYFRAKGRLL